MTEPESTLAARIAVIRQEYLARLHDESLPKLRALRQRFAETPQDDEVRKQLLHAAHDMTGSGAVFGFDAVSADGRRLEDALRAAIKQSGDIAGERLSDLLALADRLIETCAATAAHRAAPGNPG